MTDLTIRYSYKDAPTIKAFSECDAFIRGLMGPFRSGKSGGCSVEIARRGQRMPRCADGIKKSRFLVVRNTYGQLRDTTIKTFHQWFPPIHFGEYSEAHHPEFKIKAFEGCDIEVLFRALDRPDHVANLLSMEVTGAWVNEAREVPWAIIDALQGRVGQYPPLRECGPYWNGLWLDTNPPDEDSKWYKFFEEQDLPADFAKLFKQPSGLSPFAENIPNLVNGRQYYERLAVGKAPEWVKVYIHGQYGFVVDGKPVYGEYVDNLHCSETVEPVSGVPIYRGWDFGLTPACVLLQVLPGGRIIVFDEIVSEDMGIDRFSDDVLEYCAGAFRGDADKIRWIDVGDPAGNSRSQTDERTCFEIMRGKGIWIEPGLQTPAIRIESVKKPLNTIRSGKPQLMIHPRCRMLRKGFMGGYQFRRLKTTAERFADEPEKNAFSHPHDALQYPMTIIIGPTLLNMAPDEDLDEGFYGSHADDPTRNQTTGY